MKAEIIALRHQVLVLSARTPSALDSMAGRLVSHLETHRTCVLADVAFTLQQGRAEFDHRRVAIGTTAAEVARRLMAAEAITGCAEGGAREVAFGKMRAMVEAARMLRAEHG